MTITLQSQDPLEQVKEMERLFPGVWFVPHTPTDRELWAVNHLRKPKAILLPHAIFLYEEIDPKADHQTLRSLMEAYNLCQVEGKASLTALSVVSGLSFLETFVAIKGAYFEDDYYKCLLGLERDPSQNGKLVYTMVTRLEYRPWTRAATRGSDYSQGRITRRKLR